LSYFRNIYKKKNIPNIKVNIGQNKSNVMKSTLQDSIANLPDTHRIVFLMKTIHNYKTEDICKELGITRSNFWDIIHESRLKLMADLEDIRLKKQAGVVPNFKTLIDE
jgi:DNA-directed RNA polymerase specialized sigma24 family protein